MLKSQKKESLKSKEKLTGFISELTSNEALVKADTPPKEALDRANKIKKKFDESIRKIAQYQSYRETLKQPANPIPEIAQFEAGFEIRHKIWHIRQTFGE